MSISLLNWLVFLNGNNDFPLLIMTFLFIFFFLLLFSLLNFFWIDCLFVYFVLLLLNLYYSQCVMGYVSKGFLDCLNTFLEIMQKTISKFNTQIQNF